MSRKDGLETTDKVELLRYLSFQVHRKRDIAEVLQEKVDLGCRGTHRKIYRPAAEALAKEETLAALQALDLFDNNVAAVLSVVLDSKDHRLLSDALHRLADVYEQTDD